MAVDPYSFAILISVIIFIALGNYSGRRVKQIDDYFVAGRRCPTILISSTIVASVFSTSIFLGEAGFTYDGQMGPYILFPGIAVAGYVYGALFFGTYLRRSRASTVAAFFGERFNSFRVQQAAGVTIILGLGGYLIVVTQGAGILLSELTDLNYTQGVILSWLSYTIFTIYSGSRGVILTDTLMFFLFAVATAIFAIYIVNHFGGVSHSIELLTQIESKPDLTSWHGTVGVNTEWPTPTDYLIWAIAVDMSWAMVYAVGPWQAGRHLMARDEHVVIRSAIYACLAVTFMQFLIYGAGGLINLADPGITPSETVIIWASMNLVPTLLGALLLAGIVAAALSSASTFLSLVGFSISNDIVNREADLTLGFTRKVMFFTGIIVLPLSLYFPPNVFWLMTFIGTVFASSWGAVGFMSIWSSRITASAAFWGITNGFVFNVIPAWLEYLNYITLPSYASPVIIGALVSLVTIILVSLYTKVTSEEAEYRSRLHQTPDSDRDLSKTKITLFAPGMLIVYGFVMPVLLIAYYVFPYQKASGNLTENGGVNWFGGEAILALSSAVTFISLGVIAAAVVWHRYKTRSNF